MSSTDDITMAVKGAVLEAAKIRRLAKDGEKRAMNRSGAYVWRVLRNLLSKKGKTAHETAPEGKPPLSHTGAMARSVQFAYDYSSELIGPTKIGPGTAPAALDAGGESLVYDHGKRVPAQIRQHPFLGPALNASIAAGKIPEHWRDCIRN